jgi:ribosome-associated translation inhibitor RaiA
MKIILRYRGMNARPVWRELLDAQLSKLTPLAQIASAAVTVKREYQGRPKLRVCTSLEVPGPNFHAEASDHTFPAAARKMVKDLERQIRSRKGHLSAKRKSNVQLGLLPGGRRCQLLARCAAGA